MKDVKQFASMWALILVASVMIVASVIAGLFFVIGGITWHSFEDHIILFTICIALGLISGYIGTRMEIRVNKLV